MARARAAAGKGETALQRMEYDDAERFFRKAIALEPALPTAHLGLGAALVGQRRYADALGSLAEAEARFTDYEQQQQEAGRVAVERMEESQRQVTTLEDTYGVFHQVPNKFGLREDVVGMMNVDTASQIPAQLYYLQGLARARTGDVVGGVERMERCLDIEPGHALAHYNLAVAYSEIGDTREAKTHLEAAVAGGIEPPAALVAHINTVVDTVVVADASANE
jgi:tetratricopeptide (TPR) repeat protein